MDNEALIKMSFRGGGRGQTTQWVQPASAPLVIPDLAFENPIRPTFLNCANSSMALCHRRFGSSPENFGHCMYGFLVASRLLPPEVMALAEDARVNTSGSFAEGAAHSCELTVPYGGYPRIMDYY